MIDLDGKEEINSGKGSCVIVSEVFQENSVKKSLQTLGVNIKQE